MTQTMSTALTQMDDTRDLGTTLEAWVNTVRIDREIGRDPHTDRDAQRALARRNELMDELHAQALATDLLRSKVLEDDDRLLGVLLEQPDALNAYLSARAIRNELHARALKIHPRPTAVCAYANKCGLTGTEDCPDDYKGSESCPTC